MKAIMSPTCITPSLTPWLPAQTMSTVTQFMTNIMSGIMKLMARLVNSCVVMRSHEASSKRSSSCFWRPKARMGMMPSSISRATRFTRSTYFCIFLNLGMVRPMSTPTTAETAMTATPMVHSRPVWVANTRMSATMPMTGAIRTMRTKSVVAIWICWMSLVQRVMSDAWLNFPTSAGEKCMTLLNVSRRRSRAMVHAVCEATAPVRMVATRLTAHRANILMDMLAR